MYRRRLTCKQCLRSFLQGEVGSNPHQVCSAKCLAEAEAKAPPAMTGKLRSVNRRARA